MDKLRKVEDFSYFNPIHLKGEGEVETVTFKVSDFENLVIAVEARVIFEINEGKKAMSHKVVEMQFKYLDDKCTAEDVLAALEEHKKSYFPKKNFSANWETGELSLFGISFKCGEPPLKNTGYFPLKEIAENLSVELTDIENVLKKYGAMLGDGTRCGDENPEEFIGPDGSLIKDVDPVSFVLIDVCDEDLNPLGLYGSEDFIKGLLELDRKSTE